MRIRTLFAATALLVQGFFAAASSQSVNSVIPVPESVEFAGQTIKLDRADLRERMDRELIAFTYSHNMSTLMIKRANKYFPQIEPILERMGIPDDLKYLMVILCQPLTRTEELINT